METHEATFPVNSELIGGDLNALDVVVRFVRTAARGGFFMQSFTGCVLESIRSTVEYCRPRSCMKQFQTIEGRFKLLTTVSLHGVHYKAVYKTLSLWRVVLQKRLCYQPLKKFFTFYGVTSFTTVFTKVHLWSLPLVSRNSSKRHIVFLQCPFE
jgi:hypothetical protein